MMERASLVVLVAGLLACGCEKKNTWCQEHLDDSECPDAGTDGSRTCTGDEQCSAPTAACDASTMTCVECTTSNASACTGTTPVCGSDHTCGACEAHRECASDACLPDGSCADEASVAFVAPAPAGTDNTLCTRTAPCTKVAKALATTRPFVKFSDVTDEGRVVTIDDQNVTLLAEPGAKLVRTANGIVLEVKGASHVAIYDLEISGGSGSQGIGVSMPPGNTATLGLVRAKIINNAGGGISASGGSLTVSQSTISGNAGGGISVMNGTFEIVGNVFFNNGAQTGSVGGVSITTSQNAANRLEFNSFNKNQAQAGIGAAVHCVAGTFTAKNNILSENGTLTNMNQVGGTCEHTYSIVRPGPLPPGTGNSTDDPMFANTTTGNLHVMPGSPARNAADPASDLTGIAERDLDGDKRTPPADIGADEVP